MSEVESFWDQVGRTDLQFQTETERFALYLSDRIDVLGDPYIEEVLAFELALNRLRFVGTGSGTAGCDPRQQVVRFNHNPEIVLGHLSDRIVPPTEPKRGDFRLFLKMASDGIHMWSIDASPTPPNT